jgi:hypothetical protein
MSNNTNAQSKFYRDLEFNRFGWIAIILTLVGCLGGLTVGLGAIGNTATLILVVIPTMVTLSFLLAVSPMKWILNAAIISISIDLLLMTWYLFF